MRLSISKSKNSINYYVADSHREGKKVVTSLVEKIGSHSELLAKGHTDPEAYAKEYVKRYNENLKNNILSFTEKINLTDELPSSSLISKPTYKNIGWIFPFQIYNQLKINDFIKSTDTRIKFDIDNIIKFLSIARILKPASKKATLDLVDNFLGSKSYNLIDSYRTLEFLSKNNDLLQKHLFQQTKNIISLNTDVFYYDCTNYYFETESQDDDLYNDDGDIIQWGLRKYGASKEHRPNPIVQMGLFIDSNGIPVSYSLDPGNKGEQPTVIPLERKMIQNYKESKFIYCSDAGLGSYDIRFFNSLNGRNYVVTQSLKKINEKDINLIFSDANWKFVDDDSKVSLNEFINAINKKINGEELSEKEIKLLEKDMIYKAYPISHDVPAKFIKELGIKLSGKLQMDEVIYVTFSQKYYIYQKEVFNKQLDRAKKMVDDNIDISRKRQNDPARLITSLPLSNYGEVIDKTINKLDSDAIINEEKYHGFYAIATNLDKNVKEIIGINAQRWKIEQSFRLLKTDFDSRPAYVWNEDSIRGHFAICYISLLIFRILERKLIDKNSDYKFSSSNIIKTLNNLNVIERNDSIYQSIYTGSNILDALNNSFDLTLNKKYYKKNVLNSLFK